MKVSIAYVTQASARTSRLPCTSRFTFPTSSALTYTRVISTSVKLKLDGKVSPKASFAEFTSEHENLGSSVRDYFQIFYYAVRRYVRTYTPRVRYFTQPVSLKRRASYFYEMMTRSLRMTHLNIINVRVCTYRLARAYKSKHER